MVVPLKVDGAFHSYLMNPASSKLSKELETTPISKSIFQSWQISALDM